MQKSHTRQAAASDAVLPIWRQSLSNGRERVGNKEHTQTVYNTKGTQIHCTRQAAASDAVLPIWRQSLSNRREEVGKQAQKQRNKALTLAHAQTIHYTRS